MNRYPRDTLNTQTVIDAGGYRLVSWIPPVRARSTTTTFANRRTTHGACSTGPAT